MPDHAGRRYGRLSVVGFLERTASGKTRWLVRCVCGGYEYRTSKAVCRADPLDACTDCRHQAHLRTQGAAIQYGAKVAYALRDAEFARIREEARGPRPAARARVVAMPCAFAEDPPAAEPVRPATRGAVLASYAVARAGKRHPAEAAPAGPQGPEAAFATVARQAIRSAILARVADGVKESDLIGALVGEHPTVEGLVNDVLKGMIADAEIVAVRYCIAGLAVGGGRFLLPSGSRVEPAIPAGPTAGPDRKGAGD